MLVFRTLLKAFMTDRIFEIIQIISAILLVLAILLQNRGTGLGAAFGGEGNVYRTKRGLEKKLFYATIVLAVIFFGVSLANVLI
jgi:preprotein translocase subunit SecG